MAVFTDQDSGAYSDLAHEIAADRNDALVERVDAINDDEDAICVVPTDHLTVDLLVQLQKRQLAAGPEGGRFGIVTGLTADSARDLYHREPGSNAVHAILSTNEFDDRSCRDDDAVVHTRYDATADALADLADRGLESISGDFSSKSIHTYLGDGLICGVPTRHDVTDFDPPYPPCVESGEMDCPLDNDLVRADQLDVDHVFLASCLPSLVPRVQKEVPVHVAFNLLENAASLITAYRQIAVTPTQPLLHYNLLRSGYDAGERCYLLLRQSHALDVDWLPFVLYGTPDTAVQQPLAQAYDADVTVDGDSVHCALSDVDANVVDLTLPADPLDTTGRLLVKNRTDARSDIRLHYAVFEEPDGVRLLVHSWGRIQADSLYLEITGDNAEEREYERLLSCLENARHVQKMNVDSAKLRNQINNLDNHLDGFRPNLWDQQYRANAHRDVTDKLDEIRHHSNQIPETIQEILTDREQSALARLYHDNIAATEHWDTDTTSYCCGYRVFKKQFELDPDGRQRIRAMCPGCYCIYDVPVHPDGSYVYPRLEGDFTFQRDTTNELTVTFENPLDVPMDTYCFMWLSSTAEVVHGAPVFDPDHRTTTLAPGEELATTFEAEPPEQLPQDALPHHNNYDNDYTFHCYVVGNNDVYVGSHKTAPLYP